MDDQKNRVKKFLSRMENIKDAKNIPLIILEKNKGAGFWQEVDKNMIYFALDNPNDYQILIDQIAANQESGNRILIDIQTDPQSRIINLFKEIAEFGRISLKNGDNKLEGDLNIETGLILVTSQRDCIENKISYKNFYNLFDSAFILD